MQDSIACIAMMLIIVTDYNVHGQGIRLVDGKEGHVEYCHNNEWLRVCNEAWTDFEAQLVCQKLGLSNFSYASSTSCALEEGSNKSIVFSCNRTVKNLTLGDCSSQLREGYCTDAEVSCSGKATCSTNKLLSLKIVLPILASMALILLVTVGCVCWRRKHKSTTPNKQSIHVKTNESYFIEANTLQELREKSEQMNSYRMDSDSLKSKNTETTDTPTVGQWRDTSASASYTTPKIAVTSMPPADTAPKYWNLGAGNLKTEERKTRTSAMYENPLNVAVKTNKETSTCSNGIDVLPVPYEVPT